VPEIGCQACNKGTEYLSPANASDEGQPFGPHQKEAPSRLRGKGRQLFKDRFVS
jgi:hypothetical protein